MMTVVPDPLVRVEMKANEAIQWLTDNAEGLFNICCARCDSPFEHEGHAVAAPSEWFGLLQENEALAKMVLALVVVACAAREQAHEHPWCAWGDDAYGIHIYKPGAENNGCPQCVALARLDHQTQI